HPFEQPHEGDDPGQAKAWEAKYLNGCGRLSHWARLRQRHGHKRIDRYKTDDHARADEFAGPPVHILSKFYSRATCKNLPGGAARWEMGPRVSARPRVNFIAQTRCQGHPPHQVRPLR